MFRKSFVLWRSTLNPQPLNPKPGSWGFEVSGLRVDQDPSSVPPPPVEFAMVIFPAPYESTHVTLGLAKGSYVVPFWGVVYQNPLLTNPKGTTLEPLGRVSGLRFRATVLSRKLQDELEQGTKGNHPLVLVVVPGGLGVVYLVGFRN